MGLFCLLRRYGLFVSALLRFGVVHRSAAPRPKGWGISWVLVSCYVRINQGAWGALLETENLEALKFPSPALAVNR